jgi:type I restriction enzyme M protein
LQKQVRTVEDQKTLQTRSVFGVEPKPLPYLLAQMNLLLHGFDAPQIDSGNALRFKLTEIGEKDRVDVILTNPPFGGEEEKGIQANFPEDRRTSETALLFLQLIMRRLRRSLTPAGRQARAAVIVPESVMGDSGVAERIRRAVTEEFRLHTILRLPKGVFEPYSDIQTNVLFFESGPPDSHVWFYQHYVPSHRRAMRNPSYTATQPLGFDELVPILKWWDRRVENDAAWRVSIDDIRARRYSLDFRHPRRLSASVSPFRSVAVDIATRTCAVSDDLREWVNDPTIVDAVEGAQGEPVALGSFLFPVKQEAPVRPDSRYKQVTVRLYGKGVVLRKEELGRNIKTRPQFLVSTGQLIMSRIDARNGAFGVVPSELDGAIVTQDFPLFEVDQSRINAAYLALLLASPQFADVCARASRGTTNRKRLREELFLQERVPVPDLETQELLASVADRVRRARNGLRSLSEASDTLLSSLAQSVFSAD